MKNETSSRILNQMRGQLKHSAINAALSAGAVLRKHFGKKLRVKKKWQAGLVTNADVEAENTALRILLKDFPDFGIIAEESAPQVRGRGRWIIDPLDGTTNFVHGFPMFCVSIGADWDRELQVGVIYHPILDDLYVAVKGRGASLNGKPLKVSKTKRLEDSLLTTGFYVYQTRSSLHRDIKTFEKLSGTARAIRRPGSAALDLAYTARGVFDGFWERRLSPWDVAAGALIIEEAGGKVTDYRGHRFSVEGGEIVASNGSLHRQIIGNL